MRLSCFEPVDKLKNDLLYGMIIILILRGRFYDGKTKQIHLNGDSRGLFSEIY